MSENDFVAEHLSILELAKTLENDLASFKEAFLDLSPNAWVPKSWRESSDASFEQQLTQMAKHFSFINYREHQHGRETTSLVGIVLADEKLKTEVLKLNASKKAFRKALTGLKKREPIYSYRSFISKAFHKKQWNLLQAYRQFYLLEEPVITASITWVVSNFSAKNLTNEQAQELAMDTYEGMDSALDCALKSISIAPEGSLIQRRCVSPFLSATLRLVNDGVKRINMHSPIFLSGNTEMPILPPDVPINPVPPSKKRVRRSDATPLELIDEGLMLYSKVLD